MEELQTLLNHIGQQHNFSAGPPDGQAGRKTFDAISAFQRLAGLNVDGKPTTQVLAAARKIGTSGVGMAAGVSQETESQAAFKIERCMRDSELAQTGQLVPNLFDQTASQLPMNIKPYLAGFCMPENEDHLKSAFLYLVAQGALHARLTLVKYDRLVAVYSAAGVDLGIHKDAFRRSVETLPADVQLYAKDREAGTARLLENYDAEAARAFLDHLPAAYQQLEATYRREGREIMAEALGHSGSSTFYLSRSSYMANQLLSLIDISDRQRTWYQNVLDRVQDKYKQISHGWGIVSFVVNKRKDLSSMLIASVQAVKTLKQDIKEIPRINSTKTTQEVIELRQQNGVKLEAFEKEFEDEQEKQFQQAKV
jgi:hypothetical protein